MPQLQSPTAPSPSEIRATTVTLPEGMSINPNAADGKTACADADARFGTEEEAHCPDSRKVGTVSLTSTALPGPIPGAIYLGQPKPGDRYRIILTANGFTYPRQTGGYRETRPPDGPAGRSHSRTCPRARFRISICTSSAPNVALLATPTQCGTYPVTSTFTPWDDALSEQTSTQYFTLDSGTKW